MARYVALLRGVNVGGRNRVAMADLRALFSGLGGEDVATLIQSGNVVFSAPAPLAVGAIEGAILERFGVRTAVVVREGRQVRAALEANPFDEADAGELHIGMLGAAPDPGVLAGLDLEAFLPERAVVVGEEVYVHLPYGMARAKLPGHLDRRLGVAMTIRNWRTLARLAELAGDG